MNQLVLASIAVAVVTGFMLFGDHGGSDNNAVWVIFFASIAAGVYFFKKNQGEGDEQKSNSPAQSSQPDRDKQNR